jgi:hypothetical protein
MVAHVYELLGYMTALSTDLQHAIALLEQQEEASVAFARECKQRLERARHCQQEAVQAIKRLGAGLDPNVSSPGQTGLIGSACGDSAKDAEGDVLCHELKMLC